ncbi:hypothetical protein ACSLBF_15120 [Pseudoalteromonas sp. T1lg65]|uniref:hypothetical protein n=1 Tax=Pseudoalteromonas sp. T1lg65 TaxID=2077101 RepID=UPI003F7B2E62
MNDTITITVAGATIDNTADYRLTVDDGTGFRVVTFDPIDNTANSLTFRVISVADGTDPIKGAVYNLEQTVNGTDWTNLSYKVTSITDKGVVTLTAKSELSTGKPFDSQGTKDKGIAITAATQFTGTVTGVDAVVDVEKLRKGFSGTAPSVKMTFAENELVGNVTETGYVATLAGDFTGIDAIYELGADKAIGGGDDTKLTIADGKATLDKTVTEIPAELNFGFVLPAADKAVALTAPQSISGTLVAKVSTNNLTVATKADASKWTLNGDSEFVEFVPFQDVYARAITVTNNGTVEGEILVELFADGKMVAAKKVGTVAKYGVTDISAAVDALAAENEVTGFAGIRVTTNAPATQIEVSAVYYHKDDKDRVKVN